ncbi:MAG: DUF2474 domain-containing protein [Sphingobium sp.]
MEDGPLSAPGPLWKRLAWMAAIWTASVAALGAVAMLIRLWLPR